MYNIIYEDENLISIKCDSGCVVTRLKKPPLDLLDLEADSIVLQARRERLNPEDVIKSVCDSPISENK